MWWDCLSQNVQCHSLAVGCRKRCDETASHNTFNITHNLYNKIMIMCSNCPVADWPASLTSFQTGVSIMRSWENRNQCHQLSFAIVYHMMDTHISKGWHTSCLFCNSLWRGFEKEKYLLSVVLRHDVIFISRQKGNVTYFLLLIQSNLLRLSFK